MTAIFVFTLYDFLRFLDIVHLSIEPPCGGSVKMILVGNKETDPSKDRSVLLTRLVLGSL